jgi:hypothetical protein
MNDRDILYSKATADAKVSYTNNQFAKNYPNQVEQCLRLTLEKLQAGLDKRDRDNLPHAPETWKLTSGEIADLALAAFNLHQIRESLNVRQ